MNRHQRRRAARRFHKAMIGYRHRLDTAFHSSPGMADELRCRVVQAVIEHDAGCAIYLDRPCSCVPHISLVPFDGGDCVYLIDEHGRAHRRGKQ